MSSQDGSHSIPLQVRRCSRCGDTKALTDFVKNNRKPSGFGYECKACMRKRSAAWKAANRDKHKAYNDAYRAANPEKVRAGIRKWQEEHKEQEAARLRASYLKRRDVFLAARRAEYAADPQKFQERTRRSEAAKPEMYRARRKAIDAQRKAGVAASTDDRDYCQILGRDLCSYCGVVATQVDHIVPVARGGRGDWSNLTAACARCNQQKHAKPLLTYLLEAA